MYTHIGLVCVTYTMENKIEEISLLNLGMQLTLFKNLFF